MAEKRTWSIREHAQFAVIGGTLYVLLETLWRGHSHWTMFLLGAFCFVSIGLLNEIWPRMPVPAQMAAGALIVTAAELATGLVVNVRLGWDVWDYSNLPGNFMGQICLPYTAAWFALSGAAIVAEDGLHRLFDGAARETKPS